MKKIYYKGKTTRYGEGFEQGFCWGLFAAAVMYVLVTVL